MPVTIILLFMIFLAASVGISAVLPVIGRLAAICVVVIGGSALYLSLFEVPYGVGEGIIILDVILALAWMCFAVLALVAHLARQTQEGPDDSDAER